MSIAITEDHRALADTASDFLTKHGCRAAARALLEAPDEGLPDVLGRLWRLGWLGLHLPEEHGGSGYGLPELVVRGRGARAGPSLPGPFVPTVIASAVRGRRRRRRGAGALLPGLADGQHHRRGGAAAATSSCATARRTAPPASCWAAAWPTCCWSPVGDDVAVVDVSGGGVSVDVPANLDPTRRSARVTLDGAPRDRDPRGTAGARRPGPADPVGRGRRRGPRDCTEQAAEYAKDAPAVRAPHRHVPGGQAPLRQHARGGRAGHGARCGTPPGPRPRAATSSPTPRPWPPRSPCPRPTSAPTSTSRSTAASASRGSTTPTSTCGGPRRSTPSSTPDQAAADVTDLTRRGVTRASAGRPAARGRAHPRRGAGLRRRASRASTPTRSGPG